MIILCTSTVYAQPKLPRKDVPRDIDKILRKRIIMLYSYNVLERRDGAISLGNMGEEAKIAIPYLLSMLSEETMYATLIEGNGVQTHIMRFIAEDIARALANLGEDAFMPLIEALNSDNSQVKMYAAFSLSLFKDKRALEPLRKNLDDKDERVRLFTQRAIDYIMKGDENK